MTEIRYPPPARRGRAAARRAGERAKPGDCSAEWSPRATGDSDTAHEYSKGCT